jgi:hypothetical protein
VGAYEFLVKYFVDPYGEDLERGPRSHAWVLEHLEGWQQSLTEYGGICFDSDQAASNIYDDRDTVAEFFRCLEIVTGAKILPEVRERATFSCAC